MTRLATPFSILALSLFAAPAWADGHSVNDEVIEGQRAALAASSDGAGFGPQSPRDLATAEGANTRSFEAAPPYTEMNLCNIHFHENAEHKGGQFTTFAGNGDGKGAGTGFVYDGELTEAETAAADPIGAGKYGDLVPGDTIETHFVHSSAQVQPGPTLGACLSESIMNPQLRVETVVMVLVAEGGADMTEVAALGEVDGYHQAVNLPAALGDPVTYAGSTTGPSYNEAASPLQVSWSVRPEVLKVNFASVDAWMADNVFDEDHAHGVRNLVTNPALLSSLD